MQILHQKLKKVATRLNSWSTETYGDIYEDPKRPEKDISNEEKLQLERKNENNRINLNKAKAECIHYLKLQENILRQKARVDWLTDGNSNTAYFHGVIKDKRRRLSIITIQNPNNRTVIVPNIHLLGKLMLVKELTNFDNLKAE